MPDGPERQSWPSTLGWAAYLACSWTWCIGMFLPVLLVRDYGIWGFVVFAVPNVLGAGAMGWVLKSSDSEALVRRHGPALTTFSVVTVAFQLFFVGFIGSAEAPLWVGPLFLIAVALPVCMWFCARRPGALRGFAVAVYALSLVAFVRFLSVRGLTSPQGSDDPGVVWVAPVSAFGFLLCPYLDATFHRAARELGTTGRRIAFTLGFGVLFAIMILFTLAYAPWMTHFIAARSTERIVDVSGALVLVHVWAQLSFTIGAHASEAATPARHRGVAVLVVAFVLALAVPLVSRAINPPPGIDARELIYRAFMSAYGLAFPAYVWLLMIPTRDGHSGTAGPSGRRKILVWAFACALAAPMFWMGFIERQELWLGPGLAVVLLARLALPRRAAAPA